MPILEIDRPTRKTIPDPIIACKVPQEIQEAFDHLALHKYNCTRAELMRACVLDYLNRHEKAMNNKIKALKDPQESFHELLNTLAKMVSPKFFWMLTDCLDQF